jgi:hypothetical protein
MDYLATSLNAETQFPVPGFVVGVGDMINGRTLNELGPDFALLKTKLAPLKCPFYPIMGNHENCQQEGNPQHEAPYRNAFGDDRTNYTFRQGGIEFVMLNDSGATPSNQTVAGQARREWLRGVLDASPNVPKILCTHIPLVPVREEATMAKVWSEQWPGDTSYIARDADMLQIVREHSSDIVAVLSGHNHLTGVAQLDGITQVVVSGTAGYPCDYAYYQVFRDRIHVQMFNLPQGLMTPETDCWKNATDAAHPTHDSYIAGNPSERSFDIPLDARLPEPGTLSLSATGLIGASVWRMRRHMLRPRNTPSGVARHRPGGHVRQLPLLD